MSGIFPKEHAGGLPVRDADGNPIYYENVENAYIPPAEFSVSCSINYLPSDCTARFEPRQLNSIQSEILALGVRLDPTGEWLCDRTNNLARLFTNWTLSNPFYNDISTSICTRAGTHTKNAAQARVLRMLHCGANGIEASTFGNLLDVSLCGYTVSPSILENWGIITCGTGGPVKVTYKVLKDYLYAQFGIAAINDRLTNLESTAGNVQAELILIRNDITTLTATVQFTAQQISDLTVNFEDYKVYANTTFEKVANKNQPNGYAGLDANGKLLESQLPAIAITDTYVVDSEAEMLALPAEQGDVAVRQDLEKSFILRSAPATNVSNWVELRSPTDAVQSVIGLKGVISQSQLRIALGLGSAAYKTVSSFASAADGALARSAIQPTGTATQYIRGDGVKVEFPTIPGPQINSDWNATTGVTAILNKPVFGSAAYMNANQFIQPTGTVNQYIRGDGTFSELPEPAAQQPSDWNATTGVTRILNKPVLGSIASRNSTEFAETNGNAAQYIRGDGTKANFPAIPAEQVPSDWNATTGVTRILNKPVLGSAAAANVGDFATAAAGVLATTAVQPATLNSALSGYLPLTGGTITGGGGIQSEWFKTTRLPTIDSEVANKEYVDSKSGGIGVGQTWQGVGRNNSTTYQNTTGKPIQVYFAIQNTATSGSSSTVVVSVSNDGSNLIELDRTAAGLINSTTGQRSFSASFVVPVNGYYRFVYSTNTYLLIRELR